MAINYLNTVNLNKNQLENAAIQNLTSDPATGVKGQIYYNLTSSALNVTELKLNANSVGQQNAGNGITDLTGVNEFINLTWLNPGYNNIGSINVSNLTSLQHLFLGPTGLNSIDISNNTNLQTFAVNGAGSGTISSIDITNNPNITLLSIVNTSISSIDLSNNNEVNSLNLSGNSNLVYLDITPLDRQGGVTQVDHVNMPNLTCVKVTSNQFWKITAPPALVYQIDCSNPGETYNISVTTTSTTSGNTNGDDFILQGTDRNGAVSGIFPGIVINQGDILNFNINTPNNGFFIQGGGRTGQANSSADPYIISGTNNTESGTITWRPGSKGTYTYKNWNDVNILTGTITVQ